MISEEYVSKLQSYEKALMNRDKSNNKSKLNKGIIKMKNRYDELDLAREHSESQIYIYNHKQGEYKTTFALCEAQPGHLILQQTVEQIEDNEEHLKSLQPDKPTKRVYGWKTFLQLDDNTEHLTKEIKSLKNRYPQKYQELLDNTKNHGKDTAIYFQKQQYEETPILDRWSNQFKGWGNNVVFLTNQRIPLVKKKSLYKEIEAIWIDEGVEKEHYSRNLNNLKDTELRLGVTKTTSLPEYNIESIDKARKKLREDLENEYRDNWDQIRQDTNYNPWNWVEVLDQSNVELMRKICHEIIKYFYTEALNPDIGGNYRISSQRGTHLLPSKLDSSRPILDHPLRNKTYYMALEEMFFSILNQWQAKQSLEWHHPNEDISYERHNVSKLEFEKQVQYLKNVNQHGVRAISDLKDLVKFVEEGLASKFFFRRKGQNIESLEIKKPLIFYLYEIADQTDTEIHILDASVDSMYLERMRRRHNNYMNVYRPLRKFHRPQELASLYKAPPIQFLTGTSIELRKHDYDARAVYGLNRAIEDKSLENRSLTDAGNEIYWVTLDCIKHYDEKETFPRKYLYGDINDTGKVLMKLFGWLNEDREIGVVSHPEFVEELDFNHSSSFIKARGQNWRDVEDHFVIGTPVKPFGIQRSEFEEQYRKRFPYSTESSFRMIKKKRSSIDNTSIVGAIKEEKIDEIYNYFKRNEDKPVYDALWRPRGAKRIFRIGRDLHQMKEPLKNKAKQITFTEMLDLIVLDEKLIRDWDQLPKDVKSFFVNRDICYSERPRLKNKWKGLKLFMNGHSLKEVQEEMRVSRTTIHRWRKEWEARTDISV